MTLVYVTIDEISKIHAQLVQTFKARKTWPLSYRRTQLLQLARLFQENGNELMDAIYADLGRSKMEVTIREMGPVIGGAIRAAETLEEWNKEKPKVEEWRSSWDHTLIPNAAVLSKHLSTFAEACSATEVILFEQTTFLVIATSCSPTTDPERTIIDAHRLDLTRYERTSELIKTSNIPVPISAKNSALSRWNCTILQLC